MAAERLHPLPLSSRAVVPVWGNPDWSALTGRPAPNLPPVGELWLNDDRPDGSCVLAGESAGAPLGELIERAPAEILGPAWAETKRMPVLIKFLNPGQWLSVQVHPDSERIGAGKYEAWHVISAGPGAEIILGLNPGLDRAAVAEAVERGDWSDILNRRPVAAGESYFIPAGLIHALGPDMLLFEIQQNSDVTYRFYDWDRLGPDGRPRPLMIAEALDAFKPIDPAGVCPEPITIELGAGRETYLVACRHFLLTRLELSGPYRGDTEGRRAILLTGLSGRGKVFGGGLEVGLGPAGTILLPAGLGGYAIEPEADGEGLVLLVSSTPDLTADVVRPLLAAGVGREKILSLAGALGETEIGPAF